VVATFRIITVRKRLQVDEKKLLKVCQQADILEDIQKMPLGFQTQL